VPETDLFVPRGLYDVQSFSSGIMAGRCVKNKLLYITKNVPYRKEAAAVLKVQVFLCMPVRC